MSAKSKNLWEVLSIMLQNWVWFLLVCDPDLETFLIWLRFNRNQTWITELGVKYCYYSRNTYRPVIKLQNSSSCYKEQSITTFWQSHFYILVKQFTLDKTSSKLLTWKRIANNNKKFNKESTLQTGLCILCDGISLVIVQLCYIPPPRINIV